jgi:hypothetical protein
VTGIPLWLWAVIAAALIAGLYGRFKGIGLWPLGVDEFYLSRSIDNVLRGGLPAFPCGGYYNRGLLYQYAVAGLRLIGWSPEFAGRFVAASCSLAVLPAAYLLARRIQGSLAGWVVLIILSLSVWEIEMARFARMYAPFQAVFCWYLVFYVRYGLERRDRDLFWMIGLSVIGVFTWEGGALLGAANLFAVLASHEGGRLRRGDVFRVAVLAVLLMLFYVATRDLRGFADLPGGEAAGQAAAPTGIAAWLSPLWQHPVWACGLLVPLALSLPALKWIGSYRDRWLSAAGLLAVLMSAAAHAFLVCGAVLALLLLTRLVDFGDLHWRAARYFWLAIAAYALFWFGCDVAAAVNGPGTALDVVRRLFGYPDIYDEILRPWGRTLPILSAALCLGILFGGWRAMRGLPAARPVACLLALIVLLVLAIGASGTDRLETRYTFFLYPLLMVLAVSALMGILQGAAAMAVAVGLPLLCFAATEDFQPGHVLAIDSARVNYRSGMSPARVAHYYPRNDMRGAAEWLAREVKADDVVVTGIPNLDAYYHRIDYFFLNESDSRYETYVCADGRTDRWTNRPVLYTLEALRPLVGSGRRVYAVLYWTDEQRLRKYAASAGWSVSRPWKADFATADVLLVAANPPGAPRQ